MQLTQQELTAIAEKALSLWERLEGGFVPEPPNNPRVKKKLEARLEQWCDVVANGDAELFEKRLAYDGLDIDTARALLGNGKTSGFAELPAWTSLLNAILKYTSDFPHPELDTDVAEKYRFLDQDAPIPFEEIFLPCILVARKRLLAACGNIYGLLSDQAHAAFERLLVRRLSALSSRVLEVEFSTFIARGRI